MPIDVNTASVGDLTQLPGVSKNIAYRIINHRKRHGLFTAWEELLEVKEFPADRLDEIKARATMTCPDQPDACVPPRRLSKHLNEVKKKSEASTRTLRATRRSDRVKEAAGPRH